MLVWEWIDENDGTLYEQHIDWYDTKEELLKEYRHYRKFYAKQIEMGRLMLSAGINYSWADIDRLF